MRQILPLLALLAGAAFADHINGGIQWPAWHIETDEVTCSAEYPLTNLLDGSPETAWVFQKKGYTSESPVDAGGPGETFNHGIAKRLEIRRTDGAPFRIDGLALTNGYAKDTPTYWRNNRIREVRITLDYEREKATTVALRETRELQTLPLPAQDVRCITITVTRVDVGRDDDLCISDLVLLNGGKPLAWEVTPLLLYNTANAGCGCGGGPEYRLVQASGQPFLVDGKEFHALGAVLHPDKPLALIATDRDLLLVNLISQRILVQRRFDGSILELGWLADGAAVIGIAPTREDWKRTTWYRLANPNGYTLEPATAPKDGWRYVRQGYMGYPT